MPSKVKDASILRNKSQKHNPVSNQVQASPRQVEQIALESDRAEQKEHQAHVAWSESKRASSRVEDNGEVEELEIKS